ncbi:hypothetical protein A3Q56_00940 [Intoshia linei]|uniref:Uncharacterized protein n=1 Tax=Intoshia linei TaxID=1819745 RepID=A0A177BAF8_9BILA|nr:hypothetical protein A3Q56_00940 [Intoshia linei]
MTLLLNICKILNFDHFQQIELLNYSLKKLKLRERYCLNSLQTGLYFYRQRPKIQEFEFNISTCLIYSFSPNIEENVAEKLLEKKKENILVANSPAIIWFKDKLFLLIRIWLVNERYDGASVHIEPHNTFADNFFYTRQYNYKMKPITVGRLLGMATGIKWPIGSGPIEPRLFVVENKLYASFNAAISVNNSFSMDSTYLWSFEDEKILYPQILESNILLQGLKSDGMVRDKHWMALSPSNIKQSTEKTILKGENIYFVQSLDPLLIMKCYRTKSSKLPCYYTRTSCVYKNYEQKFNSAIFHDIKSHLRGGTPFIQHDPDYPQYYISIAHSTYFLQNGTRYYTTNFIIMYVCDNENLVNDSNLHLSDSDCSRIIYISDDLKIDTKVMEKYPILRSKYIHYNFIFPVSLISEYPHFIMGVHVNDYASVLIKLKHFGKLVDEIIQFDISNSIYIHDIPFDQKNFLNPYFLNKIMAIRTVNQSGLPLEI